MNKYLSHFSAAKYWRIPYLESIIGSTSTEAMVEEFTVSNNNDRFKKKGYKIHLCTMALPKGAVIPINGRYISSPELVFLQLSTKLSIHRLILLGMQLCSFPPGKPAESITTKKKLKHFLNKTSGHTGRINALRALKYIEDGSSSIMESLVFMFLTLPNSLGGSGLEGAVFNHEIILDDEAGKRLGQKRCFVDIYYKAAKLAIEYDSFTFHSSPFEQGRDSIRSAILKRLGINMLHISTVQLYDTSAWDDFSANLAHHLGRRLQIRTRKYKEMHTLLRSMLPNREASIPSCL